MIKHISHNNKTLGIILRKDFHKQGVNFITPEDYSQQVAYISHPKDHEVKAHIHNLVSRNVLYTQEVLIISKGSIQIDFYTPDSEYLQSEIVSSGDLVVLVAGGHGIKVIEDVNMIEVKQGPYAGPKDKILLGK